MPSSPCPAPSLVAAAPRPVSSTWIEMRCGAHWSITVALAEGPPCLSTFVSASWQMR